jgi:hypothetical protein
MGCLFRLGCLVILAAAMAAGWVTRDRWWPGGSRQSATPAEPLWQPLTPAGAERAREALASLERPSGPAFVNLTAAELAAFAFEQAGASLPPSSDSVEAAVLGDQLSVRATVRLSELGGSSLIGPLAGMLGDREGMQMGAHFRILRPGLGELDVRELKLRDFRLPSALIPRLVRQLSRGERPAGLSENGIPVETPPRVGDVRIGNGRVTVYRTELEQP